jgi:large subunit ribosomal protein L24
MRILKHRKTDRPRAVKRKRHADNAERQKMHVTKGDTVRVVRGDDKGKEGKILRVFHKTGRVTIEGVNIVKKHRRARTADEQSGIVEMPAPVHASNVMLLDPKEGKPTRTRRQIDEDGTKERIAVKSGESIPRSR